MPGEGISAHTDSSVFEDKICSLSLGSPCTMISMKKYTEDFCDMYLKPLSTYNGGGG
jgi:alkylated DNA repair dioxygenase AlkB